MNRVSEEEQKKRFKFSRAATGNGAVGPSARKRLFQRPSKFESVEQSSQHPCNLVMLITIQSVTHVGKYTAP